MAVTNHQDPAAYTPCFAPQIFTATSTQTGAANFTYTVVCTDLLTSSSLTYSIKKRPDNKLAFDAMNFSTQYIEHYVPNNSYGWQVCTDAVRKIRVNIGETYGGSPAYASGTNQDYYVWNAASKWLDFVNFNYTDFVYEDVLMSTNHVQLSPFTTAKTYSGKSLFLYTLGGTTPIGGIDILTYDAAGNLLGTSTISNPYAATANYYEKYVCIDVGYKGLSNIASGLVTGTYPIMTSQVASYVVKDGNTLDPTVYKTVTVETECKYDVYTLHYLNKNGGFDTIHFSKVSEINVQADKTFYRKNPYVMTSNTWAYDTFTQQEIALTSTTQTRLKLNSDWMSETDMDYHRYLISSPRVYLDTTSGLIPVKVNTNNWFVNKKFNNKVYSITIDVEYNHIDTYQNG